MQKVAISQETSFERRHYEWLRRQTLAPEIGKAGVEGYEKRRRDEITSGLAEALTGIVKTDWSFRLNEIGKLVADDGQPIERILLDGLASDVELAEKDSFYRQFLPQRSLIELQEQHEQEAMAQGKRNFNTIVTFSPYTEELATSEANNKKLVAAAQKPYWRRGMIRVSHWDGVSLNLSVRSIDNSSVKIFKSTASRLELNQFKAKDSTSMLNERIYLNLARGSGAHLADTITAQADKLIGLIEGGERRQGRPLYEAEDTQRYVESQTQIIDELLKIDERLAKQSDSFESYSMAFTGEMYKCVALLEMRMTQSRVAEIEDYELAADAAGALASASGKQYDMCGYILAPQSTEARLASQTGFESILRLAGQKISCPECRKKVEVPTSKLLEGRLKCRDCGYEVDACTGKVHRKSNKAKKR